MAGGRPTKFKPEFIDKAAKLCLNGATIAELAGIFQVSIATIYSWQAMFPDFLAAIKTPKEIADKRVERSLYERATGYTYESVKIFCNTKTGEVTQVPYTEHFPPDPTAMIFWLKNRDKEHWRDVKAISGADGEGPVEVVFKRVEDE